MCCQLPKDIAAPFSKQKAIIVNIFLLQPFNFYPHSISLNRKYYIDMNTTWNRN